MEQLQHEQSLDFWKKGSSLLDSLDLFVGKDLSEELNQKKSIIPQKVSTSSNYGNMANAINSLNLLGEIVSENQFNSEITEKKKSNILNQILSENLIALGFEEPMQSSDTPKIIPLHVWPNAIYKIDWENSEFAKSHISFANIRLIKKDWLKAKETKQTQTIIEDKRTGRPSSKNDLIAAYEKLKKDGLIDFRKTLKAHVKLIQNAYAELRNKDDISGASYKAISKHLGQMFKEDGKSIN